MYKKQLIYLLLTLCLFVSCKDENIATVAISQPTITNFGVKLSWNVQDVKGFKYYRIMRSSDGVRFTTINDVDNTSSKAFKMDSTSYLDNTYPINADSLIYKVMVFADEVTSSANMVVRIPKPLKIDYNTTKVFAIPEEHKLLVFNGYNGSATYIYQYDYLTNELISKKSLPIQSSGYAIGFGKYNDKYELYFYDGSNPFLKIYDAITMQQTAVMSFSSNYASLCPDNNGTIYSINSSYSVQIINRKALTSNYYSANNYVDKIYYQSSTNKLIGTNYNRIVVYTLNNGAITSETVRNISNGSYNYCIENTNLLYQNYSGVTRILNSDTWVESTLQDENDNGKSFSTLYAKNGVIYAYANYDTKIYCYSTTSLKLINTINVRLQPTMMISDNEYLIIVGSYNNEKYVDKIKLLK